MHVHVVHATPGHQEHMSAGRRLWVVNAPGYTNAHQSRTTPSHLLQWIGDTGIGVYGIGTEKVCLWSVCEGVAQRTVIEWILRSHASCSIWVPTPSRQALLVMTPQVLLYHQWLERPSSARTNYHAVSWLAWLSDA